MQKKSIILCNKRLCAAKSSEKILWQETKLETLSKESVSIEKSLAFATSMQNAFHLPHLLKFTKLDEILEIL